MAEVCAVNYVDHVGVAVNDISTALDFFATNFGTPDAEVVEMADQGVRACLIEVGQTPHRVAAAAVPRERGRSFH